MCASKRSTLQPLGSAQSEIFELVREEGGGGGVEAGGLAAVEFGADGVEIDEPALEERPRHRLQRRVHPPVQLDLVVQRPKHRRDGFLLGEGRERHCELSLRGDALAWSPLCYTPQIVLVFEAAMSKTADEVCSQMSFG